MVQWNDVVEMIPMTTFSDPFDDFLLNGIEHDNDASESLDEMFNGDDPLGPELGQEDTFFDTLDEFALDDLAQHENQPALADETPTTPEDVMDGNMDMMNKDMFGDLGDHDDFQDSAEELPLDPTERGSSDDESDTDQDKTNGYMAAGRGLLFGLVAAKASSFVMQKVSSIMGKSAENTDDIDGTVGDVLSDAVDLDDIQGVVSLGGDAYKAASESTRNGFGVMNMGGSTPAPPLPPGAESAA
jgi:hypothetical protein